ncbi:unnamed protein product [Rotaria sp. Silwood2]|nr:unnamed protein product [Rotaria sp. Silwood2]CAF3133987.1 unnamed protein product [Rotaria sp. Silwood2]
MKQGTGLPVLFANRQLHSNTPLGRSTSSISPPSSINQVLLSSSCLNHVVPYRLPLTKLKPEPWQRLFYTKKQPELTIKQNKSDVDTILNKDLINSLSECSNFDENSQCSSFPRQIPTHFDHLYQEMNEITLQLAEERLKHKQTQIKAEEILFNQLQDQEKRFQELQQHQLLDHKKKLKEQENKFLKLLNEEQTQSLKREEQLRNELEFLKQSFHTYKIFQKTIANKTVDREHHESLNNDLTSTKLQLVETKEHANNLATQLNDLKIQHNEIIREFNEYRLRSIEKTKQT